MTKIPKQLIPIATLAICGECNRPTDRCLWDGVGGWICVNCGYFWSRASQEAAAQEDAAEEDA